MATKIPLKSGNTLELTMASFEECDNLLSAVMTEAGAVGINLGKDFKGLEDFGNLEVNSEMVNTLKNLLCQAMRSRSLKDAAFACAKRGLYNNAPITKETFEPETARGDYLIVMKEVIWFNLSPFFSNLSTKLSGIIQRIGTSPA